MLDVLLDALLDSLKVFGFAFIIYILISFIEDKMVSILGRKNHFSPLIGSALGIIPQCGLSVVGANLYTAHHITMGTLIALFVSCSDEVDLKRLQIYIKFNNNQNRIPTGLDL